MKSERNGLLKSSDWAQRDQDGGEKDRGSIGMADTDVYQECAEVLGISKLLLPVYSELCLYSQTTA